jgi:predicted ABC-type exoprotein transport system permease subunit
MTSKLIASVLAAALVLAYVGPMVFKMKDVALGAVILISVVVMLVDLWQSLRQSKD